MATYWTPLSYRGLPGDDPQSSRVPVESVQEPDQTVERKEIIKCLKPFMGFSSDVLKQMETSADVLDAVVCLVAARDFLRGEAMQPTDRNLAEIEGWIWTRDPKLVSRDEQVKTAGRVMREDRLALKKLAE